MAFIASSGNSCFKERLYRIRCPPSSWCKGNQCSQVTADYPARCKGGTGPQREPTGYVHMPTGGCLYNMRGINEAGVQLDVIESDTPGVPNVTVAVSGLALWSLGLSGSVAELTPAPGVDETTKYSEGEAYLPSYTHVFFKGKAAWSPNWYSMHGEANRNELLLSVTEELETNDRNFTLEVKQSILIKRLENGWFYDISFERDGEYMDKAGKRKKFSVHEFVAVAPLYG
ncbi:hypothetical protein FOZ63_026255 [Perkinsus olseni]|uniref:Uncharacterized protein n=1 Tax=Perkinsus olseni TaxID=32597 RepID=A0A7J6SHW2_PEROL|nr:hypothetical protein FOZ63_026255 [Perkinsus olseni]